MAADTCNYSVLFNEIDGLAEEVYPTIFYELVPDAPLDISSNGTVINGPFYITGQVIYFRVSLCNPLYPAAPFLPVFFEVSRRRRDDCVYTHFLANLECLHDFFFCAVGRE